jgi:hypothetical protein
MNWLMLFKEIIPVYSENYRLFKKVTQPMEKCNINFIFIIIIMPVSYNKPGRDTDYSPPSTAEVVNE